MAVGLGLLGLAPAELWAMTPREFEAALRGRLGRGSRLSALSREDLGHLMRAYPDRKD
ncbi:conserved protein of unknown function [Candidatus Filomicrobium marinum]|uniref:Phage tail assembly chaperone n=2 Tax=Filomicrobium TaxID=119044 RepID=A0A0D6JJ59_9HYPH|nr:MULTISPECIES: phage tail assembly chaperone [Filomicrobium]MCV0370825.1 phage tail assembly chaperone [Filomicrobium sp.]CFX31509.1 conserved protein of unknown function [Candidatus Filomicrobium marinum]CPR22019.1 conserved protein of unknown function [Candidatus Filomicrobium marinum]SDP45872.1 phage conserved hypothetical protein [Filomicrobium insigne]